MFKFKIGDQVLITAGKDKGKKSKIEKILPHENKLVIAGVNVYKRHRRATRNQAAGTYEVTRPISVANIAIICPKCTNPTRIGFILNEKSPAFRPGKSIKNGKSLPAGSLRKASKQGKIRICKKCKGHI
ncbi:50S ribosomal protein L24 [Candidatus Curtissbacteria bacterium RIFCSPLOWO2_01_FULL_38_11b]|uniref:Large ribosomal subunit protein uL24 n=1 Tax=Candidatus Curtissbacteria bacterium RIFCSPLOWO2_01_FULL_38_11b TaxID=1797725 RepID=A0A1F5H034_9BACT|nr:MAG: 50S ribosomal protein L24 [Candidatus Curtissbacteria bacterium RIFCSPLOWO2_01_FULL_38_11b]